MAGDDQEHREEYEAPAMAEDEDSVVQIQFRSVVHISCQKI